MSRQIVIDSTGTMSDVSGMDLEERVGHVARLHREQRILEYLLDKIDGPFASTKGGVLKTV